MLGLYLLSPDVISSFFSLAELFPEKTTKEWDAKKRDEGTTILPLILPSRKEKRQHLQGRVKGRDEGKERKRRRETGTRRG